MTPRSPPNPLVRESVLAPTLAGILSRRIFVSILTTLLTLFLTTAAMAQTGSPGSASPAPSPSKSFLEMLREGAEWPGLIIAVMSLAAVTIIIEHFWTIRRATIVNDAEIESIDTITKTRAKLTRNLP